MNWKLKALIQNAVSQLPSSASYAAYYWLQRRFGGLRQVDPIENFSVAVEFYDLLARIGRSPLGGKFLEIGTGRRLNLPIAFWLCGARQVITIDLNPYLKEELVRDDIRFIFENQLQTAETFGARAVPGRLEEIISLAQRQWRLGELLEMCQIRTLAPANASCLPLEPATVDFQTSLNVFEHIPGDVILKILIEGNRVLKQDGVFLHRVDYSDHFSHGDTSLSPINFLRYDDHRWQRIAGNRYMYMNRLRVDDIHSLFAAAGHEIMIDDRDVDSSIVALTASGGAELSLRFADKPAAVIGTTASWVGSRRKHNDEPREVGGVS